MFCLTPQERNILLVIGVVILAGSMLRAGSGFRQQPATSHFSPESTNITVDINSASAEQLETVPGIGPVLAARIVERRLRQGPFQDGEALKKVKGIGDKKLQQLKKYIVF